MASGDTLLTFHPLAGAAPSTNYATLDQRNGHWTLDFDDTTDESIIFADVLPRNYGGGGLTINIHWAATSATTGTARWEASMETISGQDMDSDGFATSQSAGGSANGTSGIETITSITMTSGAQMDSLAAGGAFRLKINRDPDGTTGTDDMVGDAEIVNIEIKET